MKSSAKARQRSGIFAAIAVLTALLTGCGYGNENWHARSPVDEEQQSGSASMEAYPPASSEDGVPIGVDSSRYEDTDPSALTEFRSTLEPYGTWEDTSTHGTVWIPSATIVGSDFVPYSTAGHWAYDAHSPHGNWVWVSDYSWGWVPFHYGRWVLIPGRGWAWIPGRVYSSAWVTWSYGPTYVGWAPMGPSFYWWHGHAFAHRWHYDPYYVYCPHSHIFHPHVHRHVVHGPAAAPIAAATPPYVPARPTVDTPARIPAAPTVDPGRSPASPSVGPAPAMLGHNDTAVVRPSGKDLDRARALSNPRDAQALGAKPPGAVVAPPMPDIPRYNAPAAWGDGDGDGRGITGSRRAFVGAAAAPASVGAAQPAPRGPDPWRMDDARATRTPDPWVLPPRQTQRIASPIAPGAGQRFSSPSVSTFGSRSLGSSTIPSSRSPDVWAPSRPVSPSGAMPSTMPSAPVYRSPSVSSPVFRPSPSSPTPSYRAPSVSSPTFRSSAPYSPPPSFRAAPSSPAPVFRSAPSMPSPSFRAAPSAPVMHSAPAPARPSAPPPSRPSSAPMRSIRR